MFFIPISSPIIQFNKSKSPNPVPALILVVINAILEVFFLCLVGYILARRGIVDPKAKKTLNKINVTLFTPALLFSKVAFSLTPDKLKDLIIIPIGFIIVSVFSASVAWLFGRLFRLKKGQRNFAIACATFQNSNSLPIALMQSLIGENMPLHWGPHDNKDQMLGRALSYLVLFSTLGIIVRWSIGVRLLTSAENDQEPTEGEYEGQGEIRIGSDGEEEEEVDVGAHPLIATTTNGGAYKRPSSSSSTSRNGKSLLINIDEPPAPLTDNPTPKPRSKRQQSRVFQSFPNTPRTSIHGGDYTDSEGSGDEDEGEREWSELEGGKEKMMWVWEKVKRGLLRPLGKVAKKVGEFMTVPLWAALLSLVVACIPPLQRVLNEAEPLKSAIRNAGNCSVPITLVTLGGYFYRPPSPLYDSPSPQSRSFFSRINPFKNTGTRARGAKGEGRTVLVAVLARMVIVPLVLIPLFGWYAAKTVNVADDPVFVVVACLLIGSPTAITLAQITSSAAGDTFEKLISRTLFVSYAILTAPTTILLVLAALFIDKIQ